MQNTEKLMADQPPPEQQNHLKQLQMKVKSKDRQLKAIAAELNAQQSKLSEHQSQYELLTGQLSKARELQMSQKARDRKSVV